MSTNKLEITEYDTIH